LCRGEVDGESAPWLRWWTPEGLLLPTAPESAEAARHRADAERQRAEHFNERLRALGADLER
jgi:hypothetical protein